MSAASPPSPNVLFVVADDHQSDAVGALGHPVVRTPALDSLVARGGAFTRAQTMGSLVPAVCSPSRACLLTGANLFRAAARPEVGAHPDDTVALAPVRPTLPGVFRAAGYETFLAGKWHNDTPALLRSFEAGSRIFLGGMSRQDRVPVRELADIAAGAPARVGPEFSSELFCGAAEAFLRRRAQDRPFFAWLALTSPHDPRTPPGDYARRYRPESIPLPPNFRPEPAFDNGELHVRDELLLPKPLAPDALAAELAAYYGMISHHDAQLGRVLRALSETGQLERTIVVYVSDHGLALGRHGLLGKQNLYEHSLRVPLLLSGPGVPAGWRSDRLVYSLDLFATVCGLAGLPVPAGLDSQDLAPLWRQTGAPGRSSAFALYKDVQRSVTDGRWKLIAYRVGGVDRAELFDLAADPHEQRDLSAAPARAGELARLRALLARWQEQVGDRWMRPAPDAGRER